LINSQKPFIVYGQGIILGQAGRIKGITRKSGIPAAWTILGLSALYRSRFKRWDVRYAWNYGPNVLTNECDVLIALGMRLMTVLQVISYLC
jgi:acetolactate synthase-1/2/3 large subunit